ncbi:hypothetical protein DMN91_012728 [Ooceraea biroi]|uniref:Uncharacterized protein n=1 Tax=Ooceraea biroi TaxID=2015173 RepID=A0A3L8D3Y1_OOCBI|nr:uncharacterized protein LOC105279888 [Ooceraea biroi]RLU14841.1 hypothetical protein DMN91_012728 [Ooceraea biroi]
MWGRCLREWWLPASFNICPGMVRDCVMGSTASVRSTMDGRGGGDALSPPPCLPGGYGPGLLPGPVLRIALPPSCHLVCYADDTLVVAGGSGWRETTRMAEIAVACVVRTIRALGLEVSSHKCEAIFFHDCLRGAPPSAHVMVGNVPVPVGPRVKYLGLTLDGRWSFEDHFVGLAPWLERLAMSISRIMPNLGGPHVKARRLYAGAVRSVALYGASV